MNKVINLNGCIIDNAEELYEIMMARGYKPTFPNKKGYQNFLYILIDGNTFFGANQNVTNSSKIYLHSDGEFYDRKEKKPFPKQEEIQWVKVVPPKWYKEPGIAGIVVNHRHIIPSVDSYKKLKEIYETSSDFNIIFELRKVDPHEKIKAIKKKAEQFGYCVEEKHYPKGHVCYELKVNKEATFESRTSEDVIYLYVDKLDLNKLLSYCYEFDYNVMFEFSDQSDFSLIEKTGPLVGYYKDKNQERIYLTELGAHFKYCRISPKERINRHMLVDISQDEINFLQEV